MQFYMSTFDETSEMVGNSENGYAKITVILIITIIITSSITVYATYNYLAKDIK